MNCFGTQDSVLVKIQPSLRDWSRCARYPGLRPGLSSDVPSGLDDSTERFAYFFGICQPNEGRAIDGLPPDFL
jgi:hypothetical protein